jgi:hypothetical protein
MAAMAAATALPVSDVSSDAFATCAAPDFIFAMAAVAAATASPVSNVSSNAFATCTGGTLVVGFVTAKSTLDIVN